MHLLGKYFTTVLRFQTYSFGLNEMLGEKSLEGKNVTESFLKKQRLERAGCVLRRLVWGAPALGVESTVRRRCGAEESIYGSCVFFLPTIKAWLPFSEARGKRSEHRVIVICQGSHETNLRGGRTQERLGPNS